MRIRNSNQFEECDAPLDNLFKVWCVVSALGMTRRVSVDSTLWHVLFVCVHVT